MYPNFCRQYFSNFSLLNYYFGQLAEHKAGKDVRRTPLSVFLCLSPISHASVGRLCCGRREDLLVPDTLGCLADHHWSKSTELLHLTLMVLPWATRPTAVRDCSYSQPKRWARKIKVTEGEGEKESIAKRGSLLVATHNPKM